MNINYKHTRLGFELAQTLDYMIKYYNKGIEVCKTSKGRNILKKELDRIKFTHKDLTAIPNYETIVFDVSDCGNKAKNLIQSTLLHDQIDKHHDLRRRKATELHATATRNNKQNNHK